MQVHIEAIGGGKGGGDVLVEGENQGGTGVGGVDVDPEIRGVLLLDGTKVCEVVDGAGISCAHRGRQIERLEVLFSTFCKSLLQPRASQGELLVQRGWNALETATSNQSRLLRTRVSLIAPQSNKPASQKGNSIFPLQTALLQTLGLSSLPEIPLPRRNHHRHDRFTGRALNDASTARSATAQKGFWQRQRLAHPVHDDRFELGACR